MIANVIYIIYTYTPAERVFGINGALTYLSSPGDLHP